MASRFTVDETSAAVSSAISRLGYSHLKPKQFQAVKEFVSGKDVFVGLPTGSGKCLCYALLPGVFDILHKRTSPTSMIVVVSLLIALMKDQVGIFHAEERNECCLCQPVEGENDA